MKEIYDCNNFSRLSTTNDAIYHKLFKYLEMEQISRDVFFIMNALFENNHSLPHFFEFPCDSNCDYNSENIRKILNMIGYRDEQIHRILTDCTPCRTGLITRIMLSTAPNRYSIETFYKLLDYLSNNLEHSEVAFYLIKSLSSVKINEPIKYLWLYREFDEEDVYSVLKVIGYSDDEICWISNTEPTHSILLTRVWMRM